MGQLCSLVDQIQPQCKTVTVTPFGYSNIYANLYQGLNLSSAFKAALYDSIKAKDCLCSGELRD